MPTIYAPYVCKLDEATQKKAQDELYEDPKNRQGAIDTFRQWIEQQKHMKCPMDDIFLLGFLRAKHFSQLEARASLEFFMDQREKLGSWLKNLDTMEKCNDMAKMMKIQPMLLLPGRDKDGRKVILIRLGSFDLGNKIARLAFFRLFAMVSYVNYFEDEMSQVHGTVYLVDFLGHTMAREMAVPMDDKKNCIAMMQKTFPARVKGFHMYNAGVMIEFLMNLMRSLFTEKLKQRLHVHGQGMESVYSYISRGILPEEYLPDDYDGNKAGSLKQIITTMKDQMQSGELRQRIKHLSSPEFYIEMKKKDTDVPTASFRRLNVD